MSNSNVIAGGIGATGGADGGNKVAVKYVVDGVEYDEEQWWRIQVLEKLDRIASLLERMPRTTSIGAIGGR